MSKIYFAMAAALLALASVTSCEQEGGAERAGERIDETMEKTGDAMEDAADKTGDKLDDATDRARE